MRLVHPDRIPRTLHIRTPTVNGAGRHGGLRVVTEEADGAALMTECPDTGVIVATGLEFTAESFHAATLGTSIFGPCPACGGTHTFANTDSWIADASGDGRADRGQPDRRPLPPGGGLQLCEF